MGTTSRHAQRKAPFDPKTKGGQGCRRRPTLPRSLDRSTIGAVGLNDRVRNGNECGPYALVASDARVLRKLTTDMGSVRKEEANPDRSCKMLCGVVFQPWISERKTGGVVKPHGRLGPLRSEAIARLPRAAYRRGGLPRPFRELEAPGRIHLGDGFPLRCFQRLSVPAIATRRCTWRCSRDTSGLSDSVLSY